MRPKAPIFADLTRWGIPKGGNRDSPPLVHAKAMLLRSIKSRKELPRFSAGIPGGFTLLELLVVIIIIGIIASFALLTTADFGRHKQVESAVEQFKQIIIYTQQQAITRATVYGVEINQQGYQFLRFKETEDKQKPWQVIGNDPILKKYSWPKGIHLTIATDNSAKFPTLIILPNGTITPFSLKVTYKNSYQFQVMTNASGEIQMSTRTK